MGVAAGRVACRQADGGGALTPGAHLTNYRKRINLAPPKAHVNVYQQHTAVSTLDFMKCPMHATLLHVPTAYTLLDPRFSTLNPSPEPHMYRRAQQI